MTKPTVKTFDEDDILEAQAALQLLTEGANGGVWGLFDKILAQEREDKINAALFDENTSKKFYAGYISAIDLLRGMPELLLANATMIRERRDAETKQAYATRQSRAHFEKELRHNEGSVIG